MKAPRPAGQASGQARDGLTLAISVRGRTGASAGRSVSAIRRFTPSTCKTRRAPIVLADHVARVHEAAFGQLRDMDQTFQAFLQTGEGAEVDHIRDHSLHHLADVVADVHALPRIGAQPFEAQCDLLRLGFDLDYDHFHLIAGLHHLGR